MGPAALTSPEVGVAACASERTVHSPQRKIGSMRAEDIEPKRPAPE
jgi:hypothetical protein